MKIWYTLEKNNGIWTLWKNKEVELINHGSYGSSKVYDSYDYESCIEYCKINNIKIKYKKRKRK